MKVSIIGAGNVGSLSAMRIAEAGLADVLLLDIATDFAQGKALDLSDALAIIGGERKISAVAEYDKLQNSDIVVITAGLTRKPGMSRDDLLLKNSGIISEVTENVKRFAPDSIIVMVTNPLDVMSYLAYKLSGFALNKVIGMAGVLDAGRFTNFISRELNVDAGKIRTRILGSHGDSMVPLVRHSTVSGKPLTELLAGDKIDLLIAQAKRSGGEIVSLLGNTSASFGPSQGIFSMVKAIINDTKEELCVSAYLNGEYGIEDVFIGIAAKIGRGGIEEILELELDEREKADLNNSAQIVKDNLSKIKPSLPIL